VISSDLFNQVLSGLVDLQTRVTKLEQDTPTGDVRPIISDATPASLRVGDILTVIGLNFPDDPGNANVQIGGVAVDRFFAASANQLVFSIPGGFTILPGDYILTVRNGAFSATHPLRILPATSNLTGTVVLTNKTASLPQINIGSPYAVEFLVDSRTNIGESYKLKSRFLNLTGTATEANWLSTNTVTDISTGLAVPLQLRIEPGLPKSIRVNFVVPAGAATADLVLSAESVTKPGDLNLNQVSNPPMRLEVGQIVTPSDPNTTFAILDFGGAANARKATIDGVPGVEVKFGLSAIIRVDATFAVRGNYTYTKEILPDTTGWTVGNHSPLESTEVAGGVEQIGVTVASTGTGSTKRTLVIKATRTADADGTGFLSWIEIPIRGYVP
jgi:hypothetical protein